MRLIEPDYLPQQCRALFDGPWLVFAPHPDDESYGMGGAIAAARQAGIEVRVVVVTDGAQGGDAADLVALRESETCSALAALGGCPVEFWRLPDRGLALSEALVKRAAAVISTCAGGTVFFPGPLEPHPDHRETLLLAWNAVRQTGFAMRPVSYDISVQSPCNALLDITPWLDRKRAAMASHGSQEQQRPYGERVLALNRTRSWSLSDEVTHAEGFYEWPCADKDLHLLLEEVQRKQRVGVSVCENPEPPCMTGQGGSTPLLKPATELECARSELAPIKRSPSWVLTAPLRRMALAIRGDGRRGRPSACCAPCMLVVLASDVIGGAEIQTRALLGGLGARYRLHLLTHSAIAPFFADLCVTETDAARSGLRGVATFESSGLCAPFDYRRENFLAYSRSIATVARQVDADIAYAVMHNASLYLTVAKWRHFRSMRGRSLVGSLHGSIRGHFQQRGREANWRETGLIRLAAHSLDAVVTPSLGVATELSQYFGVPVSRLHPIHNGYDLTRVRTLGAEALSCEKRVPWVVTCCRLTDQKDFRTLLDAFSRLRSNPMPHLVIVGDGPEHAGIEARAAELGVAERVILTGYHDNPYPWIKAADIFVLSSHYEGFGNVILEAMALGVPVVATDCPWGPAEIIEPGVSGELVPLQDPRALAEVMQRWLDDADQRAGIAAQGKHRSAGFGLARMLQGYVELFDGLHRAAAGQ